jgi:hypothetical protein
VERRPTPGARRRAAGAARAALLGSAVLLPAGLGAQEACLECHAQPGLTVSFPSGEERDATIAAEVWAASVHGAGGLDCAACHSDISEYPHPEPRDRTSRDLTLRLYTSCQQCHEEQYKRTLDSVHQRALAAGDRRAAVCADCHDPHRQPRITDPETGALLPAGRVGIPQTCARCHEAIQEQYRRSVHGAALVEANGDVPTCIDCHGVHDIADPRTARFRLTSPRMCAECHTDRDKMRKYGVSTDVLRTYVADFHGSTVTLFERQHPEQFTNKPVCYDCHGIHDIRRTEDPEKGIHVKANLLATCQKCHPDAGANFPEAWLSHYIPSRERTPLVYWARRLYQVLIPAVIGAMVLFVTTDFLRRRRDRRRSERP